MAEEPSHRPRNKPCRCSHTRRIGGGIQSWLRTSHSSCLAFSPFAPRILGSGPLTRCCERRNGPTLSVAQPLRRGMGSHQARHSTLEQVTFAFEPSLWQPIYTGRAQTPLQLIQRDVTELQMRKATKKSRAQMRRGSSSAQGELGWVTEWVSRHWPRCRRGQPLAPRHSY